MTAVRPRLAWKPASVVQEIVETESARSLVLEIPGWTDHRAGQHVDIRLTAEDGYQATRSYSLSSGPDEPPQITVQRVDDGEVSPFLVDVVAIGDRFEVRGPIGGYFVWDPDDPSPLLMAGGSGIAPLRSIWRAATPLTQVSVLYSAQSRDRLIFADELNSSPSLSATINLTRETATGFASGRLDEVSIRATLADVIPQITYVCGPTGFVEAAAQHLITIGVDPKAIRTERFG